MDLSVLSTILIVVTFEACFWLCKHFDPFLEIECTDQQIESNLRRKVYIILKSVAFRSAFQIHLRVHLRTIVKFRAVSTLFYLLRWRRSSGRCTLGQNPQRKYHYINLG